MILLSSIDKIKKDTDMKLRIVVLILFTAAVLGCSSSEEKTIANLELYNDGTIKIYLLNITDSRCPSDAICVWQGNAEVFLRIEDSTTSIDYSLNTAGINSPRLSVRYPNEINLLQKNIVLQDVQPVPLSNTTYMLSDYTVILDVN
ncbi:hypothetical protein [Nonlabens sp.]|uniref:hypothetical protein n=1 Tax=Nonlabens sp. TaxID=1888209 RepID=UPI001BCC9BB9|nr:hypothetical protein [Nonlabens sp.]